MIERRIYGPPGTGKTTYLTQAVTEAAAIYGGGKVMVCSFTTAAAEEIASRSDQIPEENIGTLHKFAYEAIGRPPVLEGKAKSIREWNEFAPAYAMTIGGSKDINAGLEYGHASGALGDTLLGQTTILRNKCIPREQWPTPCVRFIETWNSWKNANAGIDYTDMIEHAIRDCAIALRAPKIIFVDEAQDCTALQFELLKQWGSHAEELVMVGDDDQCIYQFAGATPEAFAIGEVGPNDKILDQSYRVPMEVWALAIQWIDGIRDRVAKDYWPTSEPGFVKRAPLNFKNGPALAKMLIQIIQKYPTAMIIGSCSYMLEPIKKALIDEGIPFHNPFRYVRGDWNPLKYGKGLQALLAPDIMGRDWWTPSELKAATEDLRAKDIFIKGMKGKLADIKEVTLDMMFEYFTEEAVNRLMHSDVKWWYENLVNDDERRKADYAMRVYNRFGAHFLDATETPPQITIGTIHSVKGGEADVVILIPDLSQEGMQEWTGAGKAGIRRLMYVGATRARQGLYILRPASQFACDI